ncbi:MAG TPA: septum site-determining protein MinD, partial [Candidatus Limnocylindria bacterium]|nr:septum site-determining protein MinD [Candidatus Limnocylindria bacterium]
VTISDAASAPARAYADAVRRLKGEAVALTIPSEKKSFFGTLFRRAA